MGCFNMTCSVSRLPVTANMAIRAVVLARTEQPSEYTFYPSSFFVPLTPSISGTYDDYGRIENCKPTEAYEAACRHFFPQLKGDYESLLDGNASLETVKLRHFDKELACTTSVAFIREDVYQAVMKQAGGLAPTREEMAEELTQIKQELANMRDLFSNRLPVQHEIDPVDMVSVNLWQHHWRLSGL